MTIQLDPPVEARLREAAATRGMRADEYASRLIAEHLPLPSLPPAERAAKVGEVFARWAAEDQEDSADNPEEVARRQADWEEFEEQLYRNRYGMSRRAGRRFGQSGKSTIERFKQMDSKDAADYTEDPEELARRAEDGEAFMQSLAQSRREMEGPTLRARGG